MNLLTAVTLTICRVRQVKKAYRRSVLLYHPDKAREQQSCAPRLGSQGVAVMSAVQARQPPRTFHL